MGSLSRSGWQGWRQQWWRSSKQIRSCRSYQDSFYKGKESESEISKLKKKIEEMEMKYDGQFKIVFDALREMLHVKEKPEYKIGFLRD